MTNPTDVGIIERLDKIIPQVEALVEENNQLKQRIADLERDGERWNERFEWMIKHRALVFASSRMKTRAGGLSRENMEQGFVVDYDIGGNNILQGADLQQPTKIAAIDAAIIASQKPDGFTIIIVGTTIYFLWKDTK